MTRHFEIEDSFISEQNQRSRSWIEEDFAYLGKKLQRQNVEIEDLVARAAGFQVAIPSWGVGTGGTRFARFPGPGEPRDIYEKLEDCGTIFKLVRSTPAVSLHIPWDRPDDASGLREFASRRGLHFDAMNSNTFQDIRATSYLAVSHTLTGNVGVHCPQPRMHRDLQLGPKHTWPGLHGGNFANSISRR